MGAKVYARNMDYMSEKRLDRNRLCTSRCELKRRFGYELDNPKLILDKRPFGISDNDRRIVSLVDDINGQPDLLIIFWNIEKLESPLLEFLQEAKKKARISK
jgi:hypothetical protein